MTSRLLHWTTFFSTVLTLVMAGCNSKSDEVVEETVEKTLSAGPNPRVTIRNTDGSIFVYGSRENEVKIRARKRAFGHDRLDKIVVNATGQADSVDIDTIYPPKPKLSLSDRSGTVDYTIVVPQGATISKLELTNGEVLIDGLRDGTVSAKLVNGRLFDHNGFGAHDLFVANGALEIGFEWWEKKPFSVKAKVVSGTARALIPVNASFRLKAASLGGKISNAFGDVPNQEKDGSWRLDVNVGSHSDALIDLQTTQGNIGIAEWSP